MRDNRSLEQKIRQLVHESNRNTELRKKEPNVGRPTGDNKLAKQGEIQRKIIDENKEWEKDSAAVKASKDKKFVSKMIDKWGQRGGAWLNHPTLAPKPKEKTVKEDSEYGMARNELETAKRAIDRLNAKMGKGEGELEAWVQAKITKASDYLDTVADYIESGSVKEETIEEDSVASVSTKDTPKEQPESGKKKKDAGNEKDLMEPGTIKGGKTEVDLEPSTDDRDDDGKKISDKMKKATKEANAKAGVKEEKMNTTKNFGLPADLIKTVEEALKGNQKKIDKNHNGKIDGQDFKILRGEKVKKEEVEEIDEKKKEYEPDALTKARNPLVYGDKKKSNPLFHGDKHRDNPLVFGKKKMKEEVEELDERDAANKAKKDAAAMAVGSKNRDEHHNAKRGMRTDVADKIRGREVMQGKPRVRHEEVELSAEELARIEEINNNLDEVVTARKLTAADKAARAKYLAGHKAKMASYAPHEVKASAKSFKDRNSEPGDYTKEPSQMHKTGLLNVLTKQDTKVSK